MPGIAKADSTWNSVKVRLNPRMLLMLDTVDMEIIMNMLVMIQLRHTEVQ